MEKRQPKKSNRRASRAVGRDKQEGGKLFNATTTLNAEKIDNYKKA